MLLAIVVVPDALVIDDKVLALAAAVSTSSLSVLATTRPLDLGARLEALMAKIRPFVEEKIMPPIEKMKAQLEAPRMLAAEIEQDKVREVKERELALQRGREELQRERATMREAAEAEKREAAEAERARKVAEDEARIAVMASAAATQKQEIGRAHV